ncbi:hypothetical protein SCHPADRAFT_947295 [Schizopora paradoxa]|uniref:Uncharacterized protein n=1 Tax=Schizopora paradoxa TaxID=27342 RepID=A0A0H2R121_9AGAM|nr:hypothetical protein SCHPADRAFT_947295 [Schizopora paradoxa]
MITSGYEVLTRILPKDYTIDDAVFRVWFTTRSHGPAICAIQVENVNHDLQRKLASPHPLMKVVARNRPLLPSPPSAKHPNGKLPGPQVEIQVVDSIHTTVVRYVAFEPDARVKAKSLEVSDEEIVSEPVDFELRPLGVRDVVSDIFSAICVRGEDPWARTTSTSGKSTRGAKSKQEHVCDVIDKFIKTSLKTDVAD